MWFRDIADSTLVDMAEIPSILKSLGLSSWHKGGTTKPHVAMREPLLLDSILAGQENNHPTLAKKLKLDSKSTGNVVADSYDNAVAVPGFVRSFYR